MDDKKMMGERWWWVGGYWRLWKVQTENQKIKNQKNQRSFFLFKGFLGAQTRREWNICVTNLMELLHMHDSDSCQGGLIIFFKEVVFRGYRANLMLPKTYRRFTDLILIMFVMPSFIHDCFFSDIFYKCKIDFYTMRVDERHGAWIYVFK